MKTIQDLKTGDVLVGKYRLLDQLGRGGFSAVFRAEQLGMGRKVAIKVMFPPSYHQGSSHDSEDQLLAQLVGRFQQEARVISRLRHPATISVYDHGSTDDGLFFMVLEYVDGSSLRAMREREFPLSPERVVRILRQLLEALREAHQLGVVHRDIKPDNIMVFDHLDERDLVKLLDFGIARVFEPGDVTVMDLTQAGMLVGTPRYMAPELIQNNAPGPPVDIYALGLVAYEMVTGKLAVEGTTSLELIARQISAEPIRLPDAIDVPVGLRRVIDKMIAKNLDDRFSTAQEVLEALANWQQAPTPAAIASQGSKGKLTPLLLGAAASLIVLGAGLAMWQGMGAEEAVAETPQAEVEPARVVEELPDDTPAPAQEAEVDDEPAGIEAEDTIAEDIEVESETDEAPSHEPVEVAQPEPPAEVQPSPSRPRTAPAAAQTLPAPATTAAPRPTQASQPKNDQGTEILEDRDEGSHRVIKKKVTGPLF
jgi:tRNA A-37 threonylcarbamoyl transferase component Bud32